MKLLCTFVPIHTTPRVDPNISHGSGVGGISVGSLAVTDVPLRRGMWSVGGGGHVRREREM